MTAPALARDSGFRGALASRDFSLLFAGQLTAAIGNGAVQLALPWLVLQLTGSALELGVAYFFQFLPMMLFGFVGGVLVDRWDRRLTLVTVDVVRGGAFLFVGVTHYFGSLTVEHVYAVIFLESAMASFFNPARVALMPNLVRTGDIRAANSLMEVSRHIGFFVAPPAGGALMALLGPAAIMLIDGVTFIISAITVLAISWRPDAREGPESRPWRDSVKLILGEARDGLAVIGRQRLLQVALLIGLTLNVVIAPIQVLLPLFVQDVKNAEEDYFTLLVVGLLIGLILGSLAAPAVARRFGLGHMTVLAIGILGVAVATAAWPPFLWAAFIGMLTAGTCIGSLQVSQTTMLQSATSDSERGRVSAAFFTATLGVRPISFLAVGALAEAFDIRLLFTALGFVALGLGAALWRLPRVREHR